MSESFKDVDDLTLSDLVNKQDQLLELLNKLPSPDASVEEIKRAIREFAVAHLDTALGKVVQLATGAEKETTELAAAKVIINLAQSLSDKEDQDMVTALFNSLKK